MVPDLNYDKLVVDDVMCKRSCGTRRSDRKVVPGVLTKEK